MMALQEKPKEEDQNQCQEKHDDERCLKNKGHDEQPYVFHNGHIAAEHESESYTWSKYWEPETANSWVLNVDQLEDENKPAIVLTEGIYGPQDTGKNASEYFIAMFACPVIHVGEDREAKSFDEAASIAAEMRAGYLKGDFEQSNFWAESPSYIPDRTKLLFKLARYLVLTEGGYSENKDFEPPVVIWPREGYRVVEIKEFPDLDEIMKLGFRTCEDPTCNELFKPVELNLDAYYCSRHGTWNPEKREWEDGTEGKAN